jgi:hypothetical protein
MAGSPAPATLCGMASKVVTRGLGEVAFVLLVLQASAGLLGALGVVALMASPVHAVVALVGPVAQLTLAGFVARGRRWAWAVVVAMETVFVYALVLNGALGLVPQIDMTITLTGILTRLALPVALICLGVLELSGRPRRRATVPR